MTQEVLPQNISLIDFPFTVGLVIDKLASITRAGNMPNRFHFYIVGGVLRDTYRGAATSKTDIDVAFSGDFSVLMNLVSADNSCKILKKNTNLHTARVAFFDEATRTPIEFDLAQLRAEDYFPGAIYPQVTFDNIPIQWDLARRDFTINAMAYDTKTHEVIDPFSGYDDLKLGLIRFLHAMSFEDDPSRKERALDFCQRFGYALEKTTAAAMEK